MRDFSRRERESLDRHITGNYGEDQFSGVVTDMEEAEVTYTCRRCGNYAEDHPEMEVDGSLVQVCPEVG